MTGYTKLFGTLIGSTIWRDESKETKIVWITMLAMANRDGVVEASIPGLADFAKVTMEECKAALARLLSPDEYSRTPDNEGRRIKEIDGGWLILNHAKYREKLNLEDRRLYLAQKQAEYRERKKRLLKGQTIKEVVQERIEATEFIDKHEQTKEPSATTV